MEESSKTCETCKHFRRHYIRSGNCLYIPLDDGHCGNPWCRHREVATPACRRYSAKPRS